MFKFTEKELAILVDQAKKDWREVVNPLEGMRRNLEASEVLAIAYFKASLTVLNNLTGQRISDMVDIRLEQLDTSSLSE
jgi:hypothetical protein